MLNPWGLKPSRFKPQASSRSATSGPLAEQLLISTSHKKTRVMDTGFFFAA
jgi:hypothetical protein